MTCGHGGTPCSFNGESPTEKHDECSSPVFCDTAVCVTDKETKTYGPDYARSDAIYKNLEEIKCYPFNTHVKRSSTGTDTIKDHTLACFVVYHTRGGTKADPNGRLSTNCSHVPGERLRIGSYGGNCSVSNLSTEVAAHVEIVVKYSTEYADEHDPNEKALVRNDEGISINEEKAPTI